MLNAELLEHGWIQYGAAGLILIMTIGAIAAVIVHNRRQRRN